EDADRELVLQEPERALEQAGLACAGRAHEVDDAHAVPVEVVAVGLRDRVVGLQDVLDDLHELAVHGASSTTMDSSSSSAPAVTATARPPHARHHSGSSSTALVAPQVV